LVDALRRLYANVIVPPAVASELSQPPGHFPSIDVRAFPFVIVRAPSDVHLGA
jgi:hypothetical protein